MGRHQPRNLYLRSPLIANAAGNRRMGWNRARLQLRLQSGPYQHTSRLVAWLCRYLHVYNRRSVAGRNYVNDLAAGG